MQGTKKKKTKTNRNSYVTFTGNAYEFECVHMENVTREQNVCHRNIQTNKNE